MPTEMLNAYIGKKVVISCNGGVGGFEGVITKIEENWIMLEEKRNVRIINGDSVNYIAIKKETKTEG